MADREKLISVVLAGFVAGVLGSAISLPPLNRAEQIALHFEEICIANHQGRLTRAPDNWGFVEASDIDGSAIWIHQKTITLLKVSPKRCSIGTLAPNALNISEAYALLDLVEEIVARNFPSLEYDPSVKLGSVSKGWFEGQFRSNKRWGIAFFAYPDWLDNAGSTLFISAPHAEET